MADDRPTKKSKSEEEKDKEDKEEEEDDDDDEVPVRQLGDKTQPYYVIESFSPNEEYSDIVYYAIPVDELTPEELTDMKRWSKDSHCYESPNKLVTPKPLSKYAGGDEKKQYTYLLTEYKADVKDAILVQILLGIIERAIPIDFKDLVGLNIKGAFQLHI